MKSEMTYKLFAKPLLRGIQELEKMARSGRLLCWLLAGSAPYLAQGFDSQE
jgi:hypothetical protein